MPTLDRKKSTVASLGQRVFVDISVHAVLGAIVGLLHDNGFSSSVFAGGDDDNSSGFDKSSHVWF